MSIALLIIIYSVFISLGLPDSFIGSSWPVISQTMHVDEGLQGLITIIISFGTIISSFSTSFLNSKIRPYGTIVLSIFLTASGLFGFFLADEFYQLCLCALPLGLGAGAIDATLNDYVANNYKAMQLNFLHACWGIGATVSPLIIGEFLTNGMGYRIGAMTLGIIQGCICLIFLASIPLWKKVELKREKIEKEEEKEERLGVFKTFRISGVIFAALAFYAYHVVEQTSLNWFASYAVFGFGVEESVASNWSSMFFIAVAIGRLVSGVLSIKVKDHNLMRIGELVIAFGIVFLALGQVSTSLLPVGIALMGLGTSPLYPSIIHATPTRFGKGFSESIIAVEIGCANLSNVTASPAFGFIGQNLGFSYFPYYLLVFFIIVVVCNEIVRAKQIKGTLGILKEKHA